MKNMKILRHYLDRMGDWKKPIFTFFMFSLLFSGCARMGNPDGGWYDETPPKVIGSNPSDKGTHVTSKKINIYFDEFINIDNPTENVVVSPPQLEAPEIKGEGKRIAVKLVDSLKANTTYTIDLTMRATPLATTPTPSPRGIISIPFRCRAMSSVPRISSR